MKAKQFFAAIAVAGALSAPQAWADVVWNWSYGATGIQASGTFTTVDAPDADGFYLITGITGSRNGDAITGLYPTGTAIPGNEPFELDNLVRLGPQDQLTVHGFGFSTASGGYSNPFFADFLSPATYMEVFTTASSYNEVPVTFTASVVPEPASILLMLAGLGAAGFASTRRRAA
ncbi:PEP-CTERM sorting domain-containing protein [Pseudorhodoferax sp.]|uniref:PEP-CTERM sorting domain-containing protein n=1 Tax=Pseudorhodoferax sp. TaxID=1993553 RepID=UPI002DD65949|nr:PEP-CTERM sorting domain-containing protein [Pseudorhodoferax sp.]